MRRWSPEQRQQFALARLTTQSLAIDNPRVAHDPVLQQWWGRARRLLSSPEVALGHTEWATRIDIASVLPSVRAPALVLHRRDNRRWDIEVSRADASRIPGARFVELPGSEADIFRPCGPRHRLADPRAQDHPRNRHNNNEEQHVVTSTSARRSQRDRSPVAVSSGYAVGTIAPASARLFNP
jgi:hypothetical protein